MSPDFDFFYCTTCTGMYSGLTGDVSYVTRVLFDNLVGSEVVLDSLGSGPDGLKLTRNDASPDNFGFAYGTGSTTRTTTVTPTTTHAADVWYFLGFAHDDGTGQAAYAYSGSDADSNTSSWTDALSASTHGDFRLGHNTNSSALQGLMDETGVYIGVLSANAMARICACGIDGSLCTHDGANWTDDGLNDTSCGSALGVTTCVGVSDPANCT